MRKLGVRSSLPFVFPESLGDSPLFPPLSHLGISDARQSTRHTHVNLCVNVIVTHAVWMRRSSLVAVPSAYLVNVLVKFVVVGQ